MIAPWALPDLSLNPRNNDEGSSGGAAKGSGGVGSGPPVAAPAGLSRRCGIDQLLPPEEPQVVQRRGVQLEGRDGARDNQRGQHRIHGSLRLGPGRGKA
jgi:hypothetical protein